MLIPTNVTCASFFSSKDKKFTMIFGNKGKIMIFDSAAKLPSFTPFGQEVSKERALLKEKTIQKHKSVD